VTNKIVPDRLMKAVRTCCNAIWLTGNQFSSMTKKMATSVPSNEIFKVRLLFLTYKLFKLFKNKNNVFLRNIPERLQL